MPAPPSIAIAQHTGSADSSADRTASTRRLRAMVDAHFVFIGRMVRHLGVSEGDVDDVLQQVFTSAANRLTEIAVESERAFLVQAAMRWSANLRRVRGRRREVGGEALAEMPDAALTPESLAARGQAATILDGLLESMEVDLRTVLVLHEIEEMSRAEIAELLSLPEGTVASRLRRAREDFAAKLDRWKRRQNQGGSSS